MSAATGIEWTDRTWNPIRGCTPVSPGCANCYASAFARRFSGPGKPFENLVTSRGAWNGQVRFLPDVLAAPLRWNRRNARVFVNSTSDLFHHALAHEQIAAVFGVMAACPLHTFQIVTKRPSRAAEWYEWVEAHDHWSHPLQEALACHPGPLPGLEADDEGATLARQVGGRDWPLPNVHLLVSCEDQRRAAERIPLLLQCPAAVRGVSLEPLLGPIDLSPWLYRVTWDDPGDSSCDALQWVLVGCESGPHRRPCSIEWIVEVVRQCRAAGVPCFVEQVSIGGRVSKDPSKWPDELRVRMYPGQRWK